MTCSFRVLGPVECIVGGSSLPLGGPKQRAVLAMLLLEHGRVIPVERLTEALWGEEAGDGTRNVVQVYVSNLRKALEPASRALGTVNVIETRRPGYMAIVPEDELDVAVFGRLVAAARRSVERGDAAQAVAQLTQALALWRGPALADVVDERVLRSAALRLDTARLGAATDRIELEIGLGHNRTVLDDVARLVDQNPLDERLRGLGMLALYRSGRQREALAAYREIRELLVDRLGLEPGADLRRLEGLILQQSPELEPKVAATGGGTEDLATILGTSIVAARGALVVEGRRIALDRPVTTIGRRPDRDIVVDSTKVSRHHADVRRAPEGFVVVDVGSTNGTFCGGVLIDGPHRLRPGDVITVGPAEIAYVES